MKYVLVDNTDSINTSVELASNVGLTGAKTYFLGIKKLDKKEFNKLWKVMSREEYDRVFDVSHRQNKQYEWWKEDKEITDSELKY